MSIYDINNDRFRDLAKWSQLKGSGKQIPTPEFSFSGNSPTVSLYRIIGMNAPAGVTLIILNNPNNPLKYFLIYITH